VSEARSRHLACEESITLTQRANLSTPCLLGMTDDTRAFKLSIGLKTKRVHLAPLSSLQVKNIPHQGSTIALTIDEHFGSASVRLVRQ
jgi:hypothetical protein